MARLASELPGVRVPPETHFFRFVDQSHLNKRSFPLLEDDIRTQLELFLHLETSKGIALDIDALIDDLSGRCENVFELFGAVVRRLAGPADAYGEKTPYHLRWLFPIARALPHVTFIVVVRDPRGVVASNLAVPWGMNSHVLIAQMWSWEQRLVGRGIKVFGGHRFFLFKYESVVSDPGSALHRMAKALNVPMPSNESIGTVPLVSQIHLPWEGKWKKRATQEITTERIQAWRESLTPRQVADVSAICHRGMRRFGYGVDLPGLFRRLAIQSRLDPLTQTKRLKFMTVRWIDHQLRKR